MGKIFYNISILIVKAYFHITKKKVKVIGEENLPSSPLLIASNHGYEWDGALISLAFRNRVHFFVAERNYKVFLSNNPILKFIEKTLFSPNIIGFFLKKTGQIKVKVGDYELNKKAFRTTKEYLKKKENIAIFVKGDTLKSKNAYTGVARIAAENKIQVTPVYIWNDGALWPQSKNPIKCTFRNATILIGKPLSLKKNEGHQHFANRVWKTVIGLRKNA